MSQSHWSDKLPNHACEDAVEWCKTQPSVEAAWNNCERGDWMLWLLAQDVKQGDKLHRKVVLAACKCARLAWEWMPDGSKKVIRQLEKRARGDNSIALGSLRAAAAEAAEAAAAAAYTAADADVYAAYAAAYAADAAAYAVDAAGYAAAAAVYADAAEAAADAYAAAAAAAADAAAAVAVAHDADADAAARTRIFGQCADIVREVFSVGDVYQILKS
jgi:hypothetical protein